MKMPRLEVRGIVTKIFPSSSPIKIASALATILLISLRQKKLPVNERNGASLSTAHPGALSHTSA